MLYRNLFEVPECLNGQLRKTVSNSLEYCYHGEWASICHDNSQWNKERAISACTQLGYDSAIGKLLRKEYIEIAENTAGADTSVEALKHLHATFILVQKSKK